MTAKAQTRDCRMVEAGTTPCRCRMAAVAFSCCRQVCRMLASGGDTVMTTAAGAGYVNVVEAGAEPCTCSMTIIAFSRCLQMCGMLASGGDPVVTTAAGAGDTAVVETRTPPADSIMAGITLCAGCNMLGRFAACLHTVVAGIACTNYRTMVNLAYTVECNGIVAVFTRGCRSYMRWRCARSNRIVVAGFAWRENSAMVETCTYPAFSRVAIITYIAARNMLGVLPGCTAPVMAQITFKRCALEQTADMTTGTVQEAVLAG